MSGTRESPDFHGKKARTYFGDREVTLVNGRGTLTLGCAIGAFGVVSLAATQGRVSEENKVSPKGYQRRHQGAWRRLDPWR